VCFNCKICIHRWGSGYIGTCGRCKCKLTYAGDAFRAPRKQDKKEWAKLEILIRGGITFNHSGGGGCIKPLTKNQAKIVIRNKKHYDMLRRISFEHRKMYNRLIILKD
jgi:hypothetical protein